MGLTLIPDFFSWAAVAPALGRMSAPSYRTMQAFHWTGETLSNCVPAVQQIYVG
jgi:hypothetical protein